MLNKKNEVWFGKKYKIERRFREKKNKINKKNRFTLTGIYYEQRHLPDITLQCGDDSDAGRRKRLGS